MPLLFDQDGIPLGWADVLDSFSVEELNAMCDAVEDGDEERADRIVEAVYDSYYAAQADALITRLEAAND
jgi:hypothetical protein